MALLLRGLTPTEQRFVAIHIAREIRRRAEQYPLSETAIEAVIEKAGGLVSRMTTQAYPAGHAVGFYQEFKGEQVVWVNPTAPEHGRRPRLLILAHELAHLLMIEWVPMAIFGTDTVYCTEQDNPSVRHQIALMTEAKLQEGR